MTAEDEEDFQERCAIELNLDTITLTDTSNHTEK